MTEHASRTVLRHETQVNGHSHVEMSLDMGITGQGQLAFQTGGRMKSGCYQKLIFVVCWILVVGAGRDISLQT